MKKRSENAKIFDYNTFRDLTPLNCSVGDMLHNKTGSWRFIKPVFEDKIPACQHACPAGSDIEAWIKLMLRGNFEAAYWHLKREQPFPAVLGRTCYKFCQKSCNHNTLYDSSIQINELEKFLGDQVSPVQSHPLLPAYNGKTLAIIGSGPAGMSNAYFARLLGYQVTIFERLPKPGGILRVGIPEYRLEKNILDREFEGLAQMGISIHCNQCIGRDLSLEEISRQYDNVFLATGVHKSLKLELEGEKDSQHISSGLEFLKNLSLGATPDIGKSVIVVGGGNTAIDAARSALRLGAQVTVVYRRTQDQMPAHEHEVQEAIQEGVDFRFLASPEKIRMDPNGRIREIIFGEMELGPEDESGRRRPVKKPGGSFSMPADTLISAIGEMPDFDYLQGIDSACARQILSIAADGQARMASLPCAVFAGGDIVDIPHTVIHAVSAGKRAAIGMDCVNKQLDFETVQRSISIGRGNALSFSKYMGWPCLNPVPQNIHAVAGAEHIVMDYFKNTSASKIEITTGEKRKQDFGPYRQTLSKEMALKEAGRCMHCGRCMECNNCLIFCPDSSVLPRENGQFGYDIDYDYCKGCGICSVECPRGSIVMLDEEASLASQEA